jgi:hypothetical protein
MENCGEHDWEVECAFQRAVGVMVEAAKAVPRAEMEEKIAELMTVDSYGVRGSLRSVLASVGES